MRKIFIIPLLLLALVPTAAKAIVYFEDGMTFSYFGSAEVITRDAEFYEGIPKPFVEVECESTTSVNAVHPLMTPDEARAFAAMLVAAADAAESP